MINIKNKLCDFEKVRLSGWTLYVNRAFAAGCSAKQLLGDNCLDGVRGPFAQVPASKFARVFKCSVKFSGLTQNLYLKQYLYRSAWDFVKHLFRPNRARRALNAAIMLQENGFDSPEIAAMGQMPCGMLSIKSFLITRAIENKNDLTEICGKFEGRKHDLADKRRFICDLGRTIGRIHAAGIFHGDLRAGNVLAEKNNGNWQFFFLDNERTRKFKTLPKRLRLKNLVQINMLQHEVTITDRFRFYKSYLKENENILCISKTIAAKVAHKTQHRLKGKLAPKMT